MERKEFLAYVTNPLAVGTESLKPMEELLKTFPFCQTAHLLYALNLYAEHHPNYTAQLKRAAAYASDRRQLKRLIDRYRLTHPLPAAPKKPSEPVRGSRPSPPVTPERAKPPVPPPPTARPAPAPPPHRAAAPFTFPRIPFRPVIPGTDDTDDGGSLREKLLEIVHRRLAEIAEEHGGGDGTLPTPPDPGMQEASPVRPHIRFSVEPAQPQTKEELIERFIREEPRISPPRTVALKPLTQVYRDPREEEEIVSETLAILYHKQGNLARSIRVYEKLCLLFPGKSGYFAARIDALRKEQLPDNERTTT